MSSSFIYFERCVDYFVSLAFLKKKCRTVQDPRFHRDLHLFFQMLLVPHPSPSNRFPQPHLPSPSSLSSSRSLRLSTRLIPPLIRTRLILPLTRTRLSPPTLHTSRNPPKILRPLPLSPLHRLLHTLPIPPPLERTRPPLLRKPQFPRPTRMQTQRRVRRSRTPIVRILEHAHVVVSRAGSTQAAKLVAVASWRIGNGLHTAVRHDFTSGYEIVCAVFGPRVS